MQRKAKYAFNNNLTLSLGFPLTYGQWLTQKEKWVNIHWKSSIHPSPPLPSLRHYKLPKAEIQSVFLARQQAFSNWGANAKRIPNPVLHFTSFWGILKREIIRSNSAFPTVSPLIWFSGNRDTKLSCCPHSSCSQHTLFAPKRNSGATTHSSSIL